MPDYSAAACGPRIFSEGVFDLKRIQLLAVLFALLTGVAAFAFLTHLQQASQKDYVTVVVAAQPVGKMATITADMVKLARLPSEAVLPDAARSEGDVVGLLCPAGLEQGEQVLKGRLTRQGGSSGALAYQIPAGMRAFTLAVDTTGGVGGYLKKGDRVDVLFIPGSAVVTASSGNVMASVQLNLSVTVLQNVDILAVGDGSSNAYAHVTFALSPKDCEKLNIYATSGKIRLVLRPASDSAGKASSSSASSGTTA